MGYVHDFLITQKEGDHINLDIGDWTITRFRCSPCGKRLYMTVTCIDCGKEQYVNSYETIQPCCKETL